MVDLHPLKLLQSPSDLSAVLGEAENPNPSDAHL